MHWVLLLFCTCLYLLQKFLRVGQPAQPNQGVNFFEVQQ